MDKFFHDALPIGKMLRQYRIEKILGQGGFGITYLAHDTLLNMQVAIKEYFPRGISVRLNNGNLDLKSALEKEQFDSGRRSFLMEAQTLAQFKHPNIVKVHYFFETYGTAYMVMEFEAGECLSDILKSKKCLPEKELINLVMPILCGLKVVHSAGIIHRDIKPENIYIREDGSPILLDFGAARYAIGQHSRSLHSVISPGYSPLEQYHRSQKHLGPWTDIYSLGAVLYHSISGNAPEHATDRSASLFMDEPDPQPTAKEIGKGVYSSEFLLAIDHALQILEKNRPQTVDAWITELDLNDKNLGKSCNYKNQFRSEKDQVHLKKMVFLFQKDVEQSPLLDKSIFFGLGLISLALLFFAIELYFFRKNADLLGDILSFEKRLDPENSTLNNINNLHVARGEVVLAFAFFAYLVGIHGVGFSIFHEFKVLPYSSIDYLGWTFVELCLKWDIFEKLTWLGLSTLLWWVYWISRKTSEIKDKIYSECDIVGLDKYKDWAITPEAKAEHDRSSIRAIQFTILSLVNVVFMLPLGVKFAKIFLFVNNDVLYTIVVFALLVWMVWSVFWTCFFQINSVNTFFFRGKPSSHSLYNTYIYLNILSWFALLLVLYYKLGLLIVISQ